MLTGRAGIVKGIGALGEGETYPVADQFALTGQNMVARLAKND